MRYVVPQTNDPTDPAMVAAIARFKIWVPKPEAVTQEDSTIAQHLRDAYDRIDNAMRDRALTPLLEIDGALDGGARQLAYATLLDNRGRNRQAGVDDSIDKATERALAYLDELTSPNRKQQPDYVDSSGSNKTLDGSRLRTTHRSDAFVYREIERQAGQR